MNIREAKEQVKRAVSMYLTKDEFGSYRVPIERQRPVFLIGAPGIGKTAIMEQIALELDLSLVSYSMTHHTRQSALGLPFIEHTTYQGKEFDVSKYTLSEIIATIYESMEKSGRKEGILFLDEINCVSETLAPSMLQFLQYKTFGNHAIPEGWVVVTAGNPPEFNRSVHEFDVVTLDRLKVMQIEPDYEVWKDYAEEKGIHRSILTYLDINRGDFYLVDNTGDTRDYITARGWEDLSEAIYLYEEKNFPVDETLISQYIRHERVADSFATYYEVYRKYRGDYQIDSILAGTEDEAIRARAKEAGFDERMTLIGLLIEALIPKLSANVERENQLKALMPDLKDVKQGAAEGKDTAAMLEDIEARLQSEITRGKDIGSLSPEQRRILQFAAAFCRDSIRTIRTEPEKNPWTIVEDAFNKQVAQMKAEGKKLEASVHNLFAFTAGCFGDGNEMLVLVTALTVNKKSSAFMNGHGCSDYFKYYKRFMLYERKQALLDELE